jgi:glycosyl hydrolase family 31/uncharacterized protein DUF5110
VFSPIMRLHSSKNGFQVRTPWENGIEADVVASRAMRLRHELVPYLYSMAAKTHHESLPLCRPMYWEHADDEQAYSCPRQYYFGTELVVAPFVSARDPHTRLSRIVTWLPEGDWYQFFTGERLAGDQWHAVYGSIEDIPVFAKVGAIVPMSEDGVNAPVSNPSHMKLRVFAGADNEFALYEDDGESNHFEDGASCTTTISQSFSTKSVLVMIRPPVGDSRSLPKRRAWTFELVGVVAGCKVKATSGAKTVKAKSHYDARSATLTVELGNCAVGERVTLTATTSSRTIIDRTDRFAEHLHDLMLHFDAHCNIIGSAYDAVVSSRGSVAKLHKAAPGLHPSQMRMLCECALEAGVEVIHDAAKACQTVVMWNNRGAKGIRYDLRTGHPQRHSGKPVPKFLRIPYTSFSWGKSDAYIHDWGPWELAFDYNGAHRVVVKGEGHSSVEVS